MRVIFFQVDGVLNFPDSDAVAPSGKQGIAESRVKELKRISHDARLVLYGSWKKDWEFFDDQCTNDGIYLNKKLGRKGLHILDKTRDNMPDKEGIEDWIVRHPNVTAFCILTDINNIEWVDR